MSHFVRHDILRVTLIRVEGGGGGGGLLWGGWEGWGHERGLRKKNYLSRE